MIPPVHKGFVDGPAPEAGTIPASPHRPPGDRSSALVNAEIALQKGHQPRWLTLPAFGPLRNDREIRAMLGG